MRLILYFMAALLNSVWADKGAMTLIGRQGTKITLETGITVQRSIKALWTFGAVNIHNDTRIANLNAGKVVTYVERFQDRLQLDGQTGSLTITDLHINDSGFYHAQIVAVKISSHRFHLNVYSPISTPHIRFNASSVDNSCQSLTVECSVENRRDVTLSWYRGEEILHHTSSPDLSTNLSLLLEIKDQDGDDTYSCKVENPVGEMVSELHIDETCLRNRGNILILLVGIGFKVSAVLVLLVLCCGSGTQS